MYANNIKVTPMPSAFLLLTKEGKGKSSGHCSRVIFCRDVQFLSAVCLAENVPAEMMRILC